MVTLEDCLAAFFAADELKGKLQYVIILCYAAPPKYYVIAKEFCVRILLSILCLSGDNMYSCERCKKWVYRENESLQKNKQTEKTQSFVEKI